MLVHPRLVLSRLLTVGLAATALACGSDGLVLPEEGKAAKITIVLGDAQTGPAGEELDQELAVRVEDGLERPVEGAAVVFSFPSGASPGSVAPDTVLTDATGRATTTWVLGPTAGAQTARAGVIVDGTISTELSVTFNATAQAGAAAALQLVSGNNQSAQVGTELPQPLVVKVADEFGNGVAGVSVAWTALGGGSVNPAAATTGADGLASTRRTLGPVAGTQTTRAAVTGLSGSPLTFTSTATIGPPGKLALAQQPSSAAQSGVPLAQQPHVQVQDAHGNNVSQSGIAVTASVSGASLNGTVTRQTDATGKAVFTNLAIAGAAGTYAIAFTAPGFSSVSSANITLGSGDADRLVFTVQPSTATAGSSIAPAVQVEVQDANGNRVTGATNAITLALGNNPGGGTLSGTRTVNAVNGVATFPNLSIDKAGSGYTLTASATGVTGATSAGFTINPGVAHHLTFTQQPANTTAGQSFTVRVAVRDAHENTVTGSSLAITVAIQDNPGGGTLSGTKTVAAASGVATFSTLSIDKAGSNYTLAASAAGLSAVESDAFDVLTGSGNRLVFTVQPSNTVVGASISPAIKVQVQDANGNPVLTATNEITLSSSVTGTLIGDNKENAVLGTATFSNVAINKAGTGYTLTAFASGLASATSNAFDIGKASTTVSISSKSPSGTSVVGQAVTVNYDVNIVSPGAGSLTGSVTVSDGTTSCTGGINAGTGTGSCRLEFPTPGARTLTATYSGDANFTGNTSSGVSHTVNKASTTTKIDSDTPDPSGVGEAVTVAWSVTVNAPGDGTPTGNVTVTVNGGGASCSAAVSAGSCSLALPNSGSRTLTASYAGDANFNASTDNEPHTVLTATSTSVSSSANPSVAGQSVTFTATVTSGSGTPDGTVQFKVGGTNLGSPVTLSGGTASISTDDLSVGSHEVTAVYSGSASFGGSTGTLNSNQVVNPAPTNAPPTAQNDTYQTPVDVALTVNAPGVLGNDTDTDAGDGLQAVLESGPSHGTLDLDADGSFTYTPETGFTGEDTFTYHASDGEDDSGSATVTITVGGE